MKIISLFLTLCVALPAVAQVNGLHTPDLTTEEQRSSMPFGGAGDRFDAKSHILGFASVADFGFSGRAYFSLGRRSALTPELSVGLVRINGSYLPSTILDGYVYSQGLFILPLYVGARYNLYQERTASFHWSWYVRGGGGPTIGTLVPVGVGFLNALDRMTFHFGAGAYAATGLEFVFNDYMTFFIQGGADYVGFFGTVGNRQTFAGPTLSIGFGKLIP
jgi:hypothetical protein